MTERRIRPTTILTDPEVEEVVAGVRACFAEWFDKLPKPPDIEAGVRLAPLSKACEARREEMSLSLKDAARAVRVPQYRLRAIERGSLGELEPPVLRAYVEFLGMKAWYRRWKKANPTLAHRLESEDAGEQ
jgi:hypothetical protein